MTRRLAVVSAGLGNPSSTRLLADQIAEATSAQVSARGESAEVDFIELREVAGELESGLADPSAIEIVRRAAVF